MSKSTISKSTTRTAVVAAVAASLCLAVGAEAMAQDRHGRDRPSRDSGFKSPHLQFDSLYHHNHYYPSRGFVSPGLPAGSISIGFGGRSFFFQGGVWFRPQAGRFVVVIPPIGIHVPILPSAYVTLWIDGARYYYANCVYYTAARDGGYVVVAPPRGAEAAQPMPAVPEPKPAPDPVIYPRSGQTPQQLEADRQDCNRWATTQPAAQADANVFQRAVAACMDGRGYTVR